MKHAKIRMLGTLLAMLACAPLLHAQEAVSQAQPGINAGKQGTNNWDYTAPDGGVPKDLAAKVGVDQKLNGQVPLDLQFKDETGKSVRLGEYFGQKPVMITMLQMTCDQICSTQLTLMTDTIKEMSFTPGKEFTVLNVSIDPREGPLVAQDAQEERLKALGKPEAKAGWHFLTGDAKNIRALAQALGIRYVWHEPTKQYIHPDGVVVATPDGRISQYFLSFENFKPQFFKFAVMGASKEQVGSVVDRVALSCFHYNPQTGKYSFQIMAFLRIVGAAFVIGSLLAISAMVALEKRRSGSNNSSPRPKTTQPTKA